MKTPIILALVLGFIAITMVATLVSDRSPRALTLTASERGYRAAMTDHYDRMRHQSEHFSIDVFDLEQLRNDSEMLADAIAHYDALMVLALEGMTREFRESVTETDVSGYLAPPPSMAHIQDRYNEAMHNYYLAAATCRRVFSALHVTESDQDDSELVDELWMAVSFWTAGDSNYLQAGQLLLEFPGSGRE